MKKIGLIFIPLLAVVLASSCTKEDDAFSAGNRIVVDRIIYPLEYSTIFYNSELDGYDLVISRNEINTADESYTAPVGAIVAVDFPGDMTSGSFDLTEDHSSSTWLSYFNFWNNHIRVLKEVNYRTLTSGTMDITMDNGTVKLTLTATTENGHEVELYFSGKPTTSSIFISKWD